jgi:hypothetical protein
MEAITDAQSTPREARWRMRADRDHLLPTPSSSASAFAWKFSDLELMEKFVRWEYLSRRCLGLVEYALVQSRASPSSNR